MFVYKQFYNPFIHQRFRESKIQVVILPTKDLNAKLTKRVISSSLITYQCEKMASSRYISPESCPATFQEAQVVVSEVLGQQCFNTAAFFGFYEVEVRSSGKNSLNNMNV